jgi:hypothetical protein
VTPAEPKSATLSAVTEPDPADPPTVAVAATYRTALRYHALAFVPLPGDAANLHRPDYAAHWRGRLLAAGTAPGASDAAIASARIAAAESPDRLRHQVEPLARPDLPVGTGPLGPLEMLLDGTYRTAWGEAAEVTAICRGALDGWLQARITLLAPLGLAGIRRLEVEACPSLSGAGRAVRLGDRYLVAVPLPADEEERESAFLQLLHECCHPIADPLVTPVEPAAEYSTAHASPGRARHDLRERAALVVGHRWTSVDDRWTAAYLRWAARFDRGDDLDRRLREGTDLPDACRAAVLRRGDAAAAAVRRAAGTG